MTRAIKLGTNACVCLNTSGDDSDPEWTPLIAARDIKANRAPGALFDSSDRSVTIQTSIPTRFKPALEFDMIWNGGAGMTSLRDAFVAGSPIYAAFLDGPPGASARGMRGDWAVTKFPLDFPLLDGQKVSIELKPHGNYTNAFELDYTDATGSPGTPETQVSKKLGTNASLNDSTHAPIPYVEDLKLMLEPGALFDASDRAAQTGGYFIDMVIPTRMKVSIEFSMLWDAGISQITNFRTKFLAGTPMQIWCLDGPYATTGSWGVTGDFAVADFPNDAKLLDGQRIAVKLEPHGNYANAVQFFTKS